MSAAGEPAPGHPREDVEAGDAVLALVSIELGDEAALLPALARHLERVFRLRSRVRSSGFAAALAYDAARGQYNSTALLARLLGEREAVEQRVLGVAAVDLFVPVLSYVLGEAQLGGTAAVVSTHRLRPEAYGLPPNPELLLARLRKEATHELGHTYGLPHCREPSCVMHRSTYVEEVDLKGAELCAACRLRAFPDAETST